MAIAVDKADIGKNSVDDGGSTTIAFTTNQTVSSAGFVVLQVGWSNATAVLSSVAGGSLSWAIDKQGRVGGSDIGLALVSAQASSGLPSSTAITATLSTAGLARGISGMSFTGVKTSSPIDGTPLGPIDMGGNPVWSTGNYAIQSGSVVVGSDYCENVNGGNTPTAPSLEAHENANASAPFTQVLEYRIEGSAGSYSIAGTWSLSFTNGAVAVAYLAAPSGGISQLTAMHGGGMGKW